MIREFGAPGVVPDGVVVADSDAAVIDAIRAGYSHVSVTAGDLALSLGSSKDAGCTGGDCVLCEVDVIEVVAHHLDGGTREYLAASCVQFGRWGKALDFVTTTGFCAGYEVCPRAHPGDGLLDCLSVSSQAGWRVRRAVRRRMKTGAHLPHPALSVTRGSNFKFDGLRALYVDGVTRGMATSILCRARFKAITVVVPLST